MLKVGVLVSGGGTNLQAIIDAIESKRISHAEIAVVLSSREGAYALQRAKKHGIPYKVVPRKAYESREEYDKALIHALKEAGVGLVVLAGFMSVLGKEFIEAFPNAIINVHPSLIPAFSGDGFYGLHVHEAVLAYGVKVTGATVHFVNEVTDGGAIIFQKAVEVREGDTPEILQKRVMEEAEWQLLPRAIEEFACGRIGMDGRRTFLKAKEENQ